MVGTRADPPEHTTRGALEAGLNQYRDELLRLGYTIVTDDGTQIVAVRSRWYWDCVVSKMTSVVYVRPVERLTAQMIAADREPLTAYAQSIDPSKLPPGFQKGLVVVPVYIADAIDPEATAALESEQALRLAIFYFPAALDRSTGRAHFLRGTPILGWVFFSKFRYLAGRLLEPTAAPATEPISVPGALLVVSMAIMLPLSCGLLAFTLLLLTRIGG